MIDNVSAGLSRIPDFTGSIAVAVAAWLVLALLLLRRPARPRRLPPHNSNMTTHTLPPGPLSPAWRLATPLRVTIEPDELAGFIATSADYDVYSVGATPDAALSAFRDELLEYFLFLSSTDLSRYYQATLDGLQSIIQPAYPPPTKKTGRGEDAPAGPNHIGRFRPTPPPPLSECTATAPPPH